MCLERPDYIRVCASRQSNSWVYNDPMSNLITLATFCLFVSVIAQGGSCHANQTGPVNANSEMRTLLKTDTLPAGVWGGQHVRAEVTPGGAQFEFDCAHGAVAQAIMLDRNGNFDVAGKFATEHAGPVLRDEESNDRPVRYSGSVQDQEMTLTITDTNTKEVIGTFTLKRGSDGRLMKCR
jgi:hypothetical protein